MASPGDRDGRSFQWVWKVAWAALAAVLLARIVLDGLITFPTDWDTLAYHLPLVDRWLREGTLYVPKCAFWYCPGNNELLAFWAVGPFSGDFLVSLNNVPAIVLFAAAVLELLRALGLRP
ncbi:MAG: hypothetical protein H5T92_01490, partial [Synergistales bacterium]|nr:hypothetical protein [Synergistales bacterium]